jgi:plasmid stabilization system protein ParE
MTRELRLIHFAQRDLSRIFDWLERRSPRGAAAWYQAYRKSALKVVADPEAFPSVEEAMDLKVDIREALFKSRQGRRYRIIFEFDAKEIRILRIRRPGQRPLRRRDLPRD